MSAVDVPDDSEELIRFVLTNADEGNKEAVMVVFADEFELFMNRGPETMTAEEAWADIRAERAAMPDITHEINDIWRTEDDEILFAEYTLSGTFEDEFKLSEDAVFEPNGNEVEHTGIMKFRIEDSQITGWGYFADNMPMFQNMGIIPPFPELAEN